MTTKDTFKIFSGTSHPILAKEIANALETDLEPITIKRFASSEIYINLDTSVRGKHVFLIQTCRSGTVNEDLMELFLMCDAARRSFAKDIHVIIPYYGYSRQDKLHASRETISAKLMADLLVKSGANHIITLNLHSDQNQAFFDVPVDNLNTRRIFAEYFREKNFSNAIVVSPDAGGVKMAKKFADELGFPIALLHKTRPTHNVADITHIVGDVQGKTPIILDDMIDTAGSVCGAKKALVENGAKDEVYLASTHAIFSGPALERLENAGFQEVIVSDTLPVRGQLSSLKIVSIAPLIASVIQSVLQEKSVTPLYF